LAKINVDVEVIVGQLRQIQNGANVHTINKAVFYLRSLSEPVWFFKASDATASKNWTPTYRAQR
jgi:hypothetical protein